MALADDRRRRARRGLALYLGAVVLLSVPLEVGMIRSGGVIDDHPFYVMAIMWAPAVASIFARLVNRDPLVDVSLRLGGVRGVTWSLLAWVYPLVVGGVAYGAAWASGLVGMSGSVGAFAARLAFATSVGAGISMFFALGEELGWRGYMLTRLIDAGVPRPLLVSGVIWGVWHLPLILSGQYAQGGSPLVSAGLFMLCVVPFAVFAGRLRLETGSVWAPTVAHAAWNSIIQGAFDASSAGTSLWIGESGILVVAVNLVLVVLLTRGTWRRLRTPSEPLEPAA